MIRVGVLALQGDYLEHLQVLKELPNVEALPVKNSRDLNELDALIIPGGESTTIGSLMMVKGLNNAIVDFVVSGGAVMGTCAGAILLAKRVRDRVVGDTGQFTLGLMDISVVRNAFGRQRDSFITKVVVDGVGEVDAVFIRAPAIVEAWGEARITAYVEHPNTGRVGAAAVERNMLALTFHPEISRSKTIYNYLLSMAKR